MLGAREVRVAEGTTVARGAGFIGMALGIGDGTGSARGAGVAGGV